jgi:hypothetical protein
MGAIAPAAHPDIRRIDARGLDADQRLAVAGRRIGQVAVLENLARGAGAVVPDGFHELDLTLDSRASKPFLLDGGRVGMVV